MKIYLRKVFKHDTTHEVSVRTDIVKEFFENNTSFTLLGKYSGKSFNVTINSATDPRFGGEFKSLLKEEGDIQIDDLILFYKNKSKIELEIIKSKDERYSTLFGLFKSSERHIVFNLANNINDDNIENTLLKSNLNIIKPYQMIFFGAPGTGKSHRLNEQANEYFGNNYERVTFHPNYMYSNFIGVFKPFPVKAKDNIGDIITYKYVPGILLKMILRALKNPTENYLLIIEEINRANVSSVFGEFFQLLDRNKNGDSQYHINITEDIKLYIQEELQNCEQNIKDIIIPIISETYDKLILPKNLYIWATMNSADQGVMPLDTAFKRRWEFEYIGIDEGEDEISDKYYFKISQDGTITSWNSFRKEINNILSKCRVPEDKLMGPYFIPKHILEESNIEELTQIISNKVLMYLYEDVGRAHRNQIFKQEYSKTFSSLRGAFNRDINLVFEDTLNLFKKSINDFDNVSE